MVAACWTLLPQGERFVRDARAVALRVLSMVVRVYADVLCAMDVREFGFEGPARACEAAAQPLITQWFNTPPPGTPCTRHAVAVCCKLIILLYGAVWFRRVIVCAVRAVPVGGGHRVADGVHRQQREGAGAADHRRRGHAV